MTQSREAESATSSEEPKIEPEQPSKQDEAKESDEDSDGKLDEALEMTFPASDPIAI